MIFTILYRDRQVAEVEEPRVDKGDIIDKDVFPIVLEDNMKQQVDNDNWNILK